MSQFTLIHSSFYPLFTALNTTSRPRSVTFDALIRPNSGLGYAPNANRED